MVATVKNSYKENQTSRLHFDDTHIYLETFQKPRLNWSVEKQKRCKLVVRIGANDKGKVSVKFWGVGVWVGNREAGNFPFSFLFNRLLKLFEFC